MTGPNFHDWLVTGQGLELRTSVEILFFLLQATYFSAELSGNCVWEQLESPGVNSVVRQCRWVGTWAEGRGRVLAGCGAGGRGEGVLSKNHLHLSFCLLRGVTSVIIRSCT